MCLEVKYPNLFQFFVGYFYDSDFEDESDHEIAMNYIEDCSIDELNNTRKEIDKIIIDHESWDEISKESNRHFESRQEVFSWLSSIKDKLDSLPSKE